MAAIFISFPAIYSIAYCTIPRSYPSGHTQSKPFLGATAVLGRYCSLSNDRRWELVLTSPFNVFVALRILSIYIMARVPLMVGILIDYGCSVACPLLTVILASITCIGEIVNILQVTRQDNFQFLGLSYHPCSRMSRAKYIEVVFVVCSLKKILIPLENIYLNLVLSARDDPRSRWAPPRLPLQRRR